jgi:hypothetical protein
LQAIAEQSGGSAQLKGVLTCSGETNPANLKSSHFSVFWYYNKATAANEQLIKAGALRVAQQRDTEQRLEAANQRAVRTERAVADRAITIEVAATEAYLAAQFVRITETRLTTELLTTTAKVIAEAQQAAAKAIAEAQQEAAQAIAEAQQEQQQVLRMVEESTGHISQAGIVHAFLPNPC